MPEDVLRGVLAALMEAIHVELPYEGVDFVVPEVLPEDLVLELCDIDNRKLTPRGQPVYSLVVEIILSVWKITCRMS